MKPVLFVSHSSKDNPLAREIVALIEMGDACKTVFDAYDLVQGLAWRPQLYQWMARCHAALILLTPQGLASNWVLQEATVLRARQVLEPGFKVFVAISPDVKQDAPERWRLFEPLALEEIQGLTTDNASSIAATVRDALQVAGATGRQTLFERLAGILGDILRKLTDQPNTLALLSEQMAIEDAEWHAITGGNETLVDLIARRLCRSDLGGYADLRELLATLKPVGDQDFLRRLLTVLASYWVSPATAALFPATCETASPRVIALRASQQSFLTERYLERLYGPYRSNPEIISLCGGNETYADLESQLIRSLKERSGYGEGELSDTELFELLEAEEMARKHTIPQAATHPSLRVFVLLPHLQLEELAFRLAARFTTLVFVAPVDDPAVLRTEWQRSRRPEPDLPKLDEIKRRSEFTRASQLVG